MSPRVPLILSPNVTPGCVGFRRVVGFRGVGFRVEGFRA